MSNAVSRKHTEESRRAISASKMGHPVSDEARRKIAESLKGNVPWNKGIKATAEAKAKMSAAQLARDPATRNTTTCFVKGQTPVNKGKPVSPELRAKLEATWARRRGAHDSPETRRKKSDALKGYKRSPENRRNMGLARKGVPLSAAHRHKLSLAKRGKYVGPKSAAWKGGITPLARAIRTLFNYRQWRSDIFTRDDFTCKDCGVRGGKLHAHHSFKTFSAIMAEYDIKTIQDAIDCAELWSINNGITLCVSCHTKRHCGEGHWTHAQSDNNTEV